MLTDLKFECDGLASEWDGFEALRNSLRDGMPLMAGTLGEFTVARAVQNVELLLPVLARSVACKHRRPEVEPLREQVACFMNLCQREASDSEVDDLAWELRKMLTFLKRKTQREEVSTDFQLQLIFLGKYHGLKDSGLQKIFCKCGLNSMGLAEIKGTAYPYILHSFIDATEVYDFQELCLVLNPALQASVLHSLHASKLLFPYRHVCPPHHIGCRNPLSFSPSAT